MYEKTWRHDWFIRSVCKHGVRVYVRSYRCECIIGLLWKSCLKNILVYPLVILTDIIRNISTCILFSFSLFVWTIRTFCIWITISRKDMAIVSSPSISVHGQRLGRSDTFTFEANESSFRCTITDFIFGIFVCGFLKFVLNWLKCTAQARGPGAARSPTSPSRSQFSQRIKRTLTRVLSC